MGICDHVHQFASFHTAHLCEHVNQHSILTHIPVVRSQHILRTLIQNSVQGKHVTVFFFGHIERHAVRARIEVHLMQVLMYIQIRHDSPAVRIILQIVNHPVRLIHHSLFILMFHTHLVSVCFPDRSIFIRPAVPDMTPEFIDIVGLLLPDPEHLVHTALDRRAAQCQRREFLRQIIPVNHTEFFDRVRRSSVFPHRTYFLSFRTCSVINNVPAHINKYFICVTHPFSPYTFIYEI